MDTSDRRTAGSLEPRRPLSRDTERALQRQPGARDGAFVEQSPEQRHPVRDAPRRRSKSSR